MLENIRLAFQGVWSHKLRSMLTMLGIIIGIASIISIVSTIQGTNEQIKQNLIGGGNNTVDIELYRADEKIQVSDYEQAPSGVPTITDDILKEIKDVDGVERVPPPTTAEVMPTVFIIIITLFKEHRYLA